MKRLLVAVMIGLLVLGGVFTVAYRINQTTMQDESKDPDGFYVVDTGSKEFRTIWSLTEHHYRTLTNSAVMPELIGWKLYVISGPMADRMVGRYSMLGVTFPEIKTMVVFDSTHANWRLIMSHELTHVLQVEDERIFKMHPMMAEYEAELVSRWTFAVIENMNLKDDQKVWNRLPAKDKEQALKDLPIALVREEQK